MCLVVFQNWLSRDRRVPTTRTQFTSVRTRSCHPFTDLSIKKLLSLNLCFHREGHNFIRLIRYTHWHSGIHHSTSRTQTQFPCFSRKSRWNLCRCVLSYCYCCYRLSALCMVMAMLQCFVVQIVFIISMVSFTLFTNHAAHRIDRTQISGFRPGVKGLRVIS